MKRFLCRYKLNMIAVILSYCFSTITPLGLIFLKQLFISTAEHKRWEDIYLCIALPIAFIIFNIVLKIVHEKIKKSYYEKTMTYINQSVLEGIMNKSNSEFKEEDEAYYLSLYNNDLRLLEDNYIRVIFYAIGGFFQLILCLIYAYYYDVGIATIILVVSLISFRFPKLISRNLGKYNDENMTQKAKHISFLKNTLGGFHIISLFQAKDQFLDQYKQINKKTNSKNNFTILKGNLAQGFSSLLNVAYDFIILTIAMYQVLQGKMDVAIMLTLMSLADSVFYPLIDTLNNINTINTTASIRKKILGIIDTKDKECEGMKLCDSFNKIELENLTFHYPNKEKPALKNINATFNRGGKYAIVGNSGSGKSTIFKLLLKEYDEYNGNCIINGQDVRKVSLDSIHHMMAVIPQQVYTFQTTLRNNVTLFKDYPEVEIKSAIQKAGLSDFVNKLENGIDTMIEENGSNFSGGEQQRIAIARAYLKKSEIIILDEASAALDNKTAFDIEKQLLSDASITCISITHRLIKENLIAYDKIFVLEDGEIVECGSFDELISNNKQFYNLYHADNETDTDLNLCGIEVRV